MHDCLIIGAGPVGSHIAYLLASQGHQVVVLEQQDRIGKGNRCTGLLGQACLEHLPQGGEALIHEAPAAWFYSPGGRSFWVHRDPAPAWVVDRDALDNAVAQRAVEAGAHYLLGCRAGDVEVATDGVTVLAARDGEGCRLQARTVVIANGIATLLPQKLGLGRLPDTISGVQTQIRLHGEVDVEVYLGQSVAPGFFAWLVPTYPGQARLGLFSRRQPGAFLQLLIDRLQQQGRLASVEAPISYWGIPLRPRQRTYAQRVLVVGDAAGQVKPTTGGGIYYGLLCAEIAAATLHQALADGDFSLARFAQYEKAWKQRIGRELQIGYYARRLYERLSDGQIERLFSIVQSNGLHQELLQARDFSFDWHASLLLRAMKQATVRTALRSLGALVPNPLRRRL